MCIKTANHTSKFLKIHTIHPTVLIVLTAKIPRNFVIFTSWKEGKTTFNVAVKVN